MSERTTITRPAADVLITIREAEERFGCPRRELERHIRSGRLDVVRRPGKGPRQLVEAQVCALLQRTGAGGVS
ncbi:hypothetical protein CDO52_12725 [Nocardiopsis gilva YIM 90087]|uniref:AbiEi antitoxin N-terminal domain-containing protein n=1 Tax=Nocardiopsis gilva YIM 90087 TaxID=1235441 RepID=A0A223S600_9ACTN|nr:hypothetical protein [Nocardiopsis gilva]ASU83535.1 hypothetical protein CDO52_12725 [Nocardiopsis gilva YIM 90087]